MTALIASYADLDPPLTVTEEQINLEESFNPHEVKVVISQLEGGPAAEELAGAANTQSFTDSMAAEMGEPVALDATPTVIEVVVAPPPAGRVDFGPRSASSDSSCSASDSDLDLDCN